MNKRSIRGTSFELHCNKMLRDIMGKICGYYCIYGNFMPENGRVDKGFERPEQEEVPKEESAKYDIQLYDLP